ncbi:MAG: hypothetical protein AAGG99_09380, partial [Pseudomonadota bacterium]
GGRNFIALVGGDPVEDGRGGGHVGSLYLGFAPDHTRLRPADKRRVDNFGARPSRDVSGIEQVR